jgi:DNA helicase HerA-like ATPase
VGVYFCSQNPDDIPGDVLGQLGNRVQHALRAFTPRDQKAVRTAAETFASNPGLDVAKVIGELGVGEALVSTLQDKGIPLPVERTLICPPRCRIGAITTEERQTQRMRSPVGGKYDTAVNRESAFEILSRRAEAAVAATPTPAPTPSTPTVSRPGGSERTTAPAGKAAEPGGVGQKLNEWLFGTARRQGAVEAMAKSTMRTVGNQLGRQLLRGVLGSLGGRR